MKRWLVITVSVIVLGGGTAAGIWYFRSGLSDNGVSYRTAKVQSGELVAGINATGTIEPEEVINVGAQIA